MPKSSSKHPPPKPAKASKGAAVEKAAKAASTKAPPKAGSGNGFANQAGEVLKQLRAALADLMPPGVRTASDLKRVLGIDYRLAWHVHKVVHTSDAIGAGPYVPNRASFARFLGAVRGSVSADRAAAAERAFGRFEQLVSTHAGDRTSFDSMLTSAASPTSETAESIDLQHRRAAFVANSHLWGVQVRSLLLCHLFNVGRAPGTMDHAQLRGPIGLRRLRPDAPYRISGSRDPATLQLPPGLERVPLDAKGKLPEGTSVLTQFSSAPLPPVTTVRTHDGWIETRLAATDVGNASECTVLLGDVLRNIPSPLAEPPRVIRLHFHVTYPIEVLTFDVLAHPDLFAMPDPLVSTFANPTDCEQSPSAPVGSAERLPLKVSVQRLGFGPSVMYSADVPRYPDLVRHAADVLKWDAEKFEVCRLRIEYPVMHTVVQLRFDLDAKA